MLCSGAPVTCEPPKTIGVGPMFFSARATSTDHRWVMVYELNATASGWVAAMRRAVSSGVGSKSRANSALSGPLFDENGLGS